MKFLSRKSVKVLNFNIIQLWIIASPVGYDVKNIRRDGSVAKPWSMLNVAIFDPWQRSLFSRKRTPGKEPLLAENSFTIYVKLFLSLCVTVSGHEICNLLV